MVEKYYNEKNEVAVLVSPGYGAGWATWNHPDMSVDKRIIEKFLEGYNRPQIKDFCMEIGYEDCYTGGWDDCMINWVPKGTLYYIEENNGSEYLITESCMERA